MTETDYRGEHCGELVQFFQAHHTYRAPTAREWIRRESNTNDSNGVASEFPTLFSQTLRRSNVGHGTQSKILHSPRALVRTGRAALYFLYLIQCRMHPSMLPSIFATAPSPTTYVTARSPFASSDSGTIDNCNTEYINTKRLHIDLGTEGSGTRGMLRVLAIPRGAGATALVSEISISVEGFIYSDILGPETSAAKGQHQRQITKFGGIGVVECRRLSYRCRNDRRRKSKCELGRPGIHVSVLRNVGLIMEIGRPRPRPLTASDSERVRSRLVPVSVGWVNIETGISDESSEDPLRSGTAGIRCQYQSYEIERVIEEIKLRNWTQGDIPTELNKLHHSLAGGCRDGEERAGASHLYSIEVVLESPRQGRATSTELEHGELKKWEANSDVEGNDLERAGPQVESFRVVSCGYALFGVRLYGLGSRSRNGINLKEPVQVRHPSKGASAKDMPNNADRSFGIWASWGIPKLYRHSFGIWDSGEGGGGITNKDRTTLDGNTVVRVRSLR
ncbi:hypothetical protein B0H17DRAFT_1127293 [Mycena rosella]|uniref:Uncharacterized protein n=1 Tax=Mycena rosella TaxID=1033263 RepID=A0AAD7GRJ7_MYCRO|nr:hypothetical protein B0H17DRAFT_1127293 [Mycena rosella]